MKKFLLYLLMAATPMTAMSCDKNDLGSGTVEPNPDTKVLIVYYSWSGITKAVAERMQRTLQCDIYQIIPADPYPTDGNATHFRAVEERESGNMPVLVGELPDISSYSLILIGGPVWSDLIATPLLAYIRQTDLTGKEVAPFWTDAGTPGRYKEDFTENARNSGAIVLQELGLTRPTSMGTERLDKRLNTWLNSFNL
ncbi:MAG: hypothetical protein LBU37_06895 [Tannerellaceae bacterium]|nr:hypothetical protein [Tannerellaceae bacterium]